MKTGLAASALLILGAMATRAQAPVPRVEWHNVFPADAKVEQFTLTRDEQRTYYTTPSGDVWLYDRRDTKSTRLVEGNAWDLAV